VFALVGQFTAAVAACWAAWSVGPHSSEVNIGPGGRGYVMITFIVTYAIAQAVLAVAIAVVVVVQESTRHVVRVALWHGWLWGVGTSIPAVALWCCLP
jgi:hypothetical protein